MSYVTPMRTVISLGLLFWFTFLAPAFAHPHVFVTARLTVVFDGEAPSALRVSWLYDDYFSLLLTADLGIDLDGDLVLSDDELATLVDAVTTWPADFGGDVTVTQGGTNLTLGAKTDHHVVYQDGLIEEIHTRPLPAGTDIATPLSIQIYDPFYYVAYDLMGPIEIEGRDDCTAAINRVDIEAVNAAVGPMIADFLNGRDPSEVGPEETFPDVGVNYADTIIVTCAQ